MEEGPGIGYSVALVVEDFCLFPSAASLTAVSAFYRIIPYAQWAEHITTISIAILHKILSKWNTNGFFYNEHISYYDVYI